MASLTEDPVLGIDGIKEREEETETKNKATDKVDVGLREEGGQSEREMAPTGNPIHRSGSRPQLDLSKAAIQPNSQERDPTILLPNQSDDISHLALDIGGMIFRFLSWELSLLVILAVIILIRIVFFFVSTFSLV